MKKYKYILLSLSFIILCNFNMVLADTFDACSEVDFLRVIYFIKLLLNIVFIVVPIALIVLGLVDFSKSVVSGKDEDGKKNLKLFAKRLIYGMIVFCVPWIVNVFMDLLGSLTDDVNWTDCYNNATKEGIANLEKFHNKVSESKRKSYKEKEYACYICTGPPAKKWSTGKPSGGCPGDAWQIDTSITEEEKCK